MTTRTKAITTVALLVFLGGLGTADYYLSGDRLAGTVTNTTSSVATTDNGQGVKKNNGPDVKSTIESAGFTTQDSNELSFLAQIASSGSTLSNFAILENDDRVGSVTWAQSGQVKNQFIALKEALLTAFSPQVQDLKDETLQGNPVRNMLTFLDPTLSTERLVFVRVRERLYEFHVAPGKEDSMNRLIDTLTTK